jgi:hypothetical protein
MDGIRNQRHAFINIKIGAILFCHGELCIIFKLKDQF